MIVPIDPELSSFFLQLTYLGRGNGSSVSQMCTMVQLYFRYSSSGLLKLKCINESPWELVKMQVLVWYIQGGAEIVHF